MAVSGTIIIKPVDINENEYLSPVENNATKTVCCWICSSGPICMTVKTDRRGYCPGEIILITANFDNKGSRKAVPQATLYQMQTFNANGKHIICNNKFNTIIGSKINRNSSAQWNSKWLKIPAIPPSIISTLIRVEYYVKISMLIPGSYTLSCILPIIIGTVPFRGNSNHSVSFQILPFQNSIEYIDAPPSYSEIVRSDDDYDETLATDYSPQYVYVSDYAPPSYQELKSQRS